VKLLYLLTILLVSFVGSPARAAAPVLIVTASGTTRQFTVDELRAWPNAATITVPRDPVYNRAMSYRAIPLQALLSALPLDDANTIQARASDGFVAEIPRALMSGEATP